MRYLLLLLAGPLCAGETTVNPGNFRIEHRFDALVLPTEPSTLTLDPESWKSYVVETLTDHGASVKKGDALVAFEREAYDRHLEDTKRALDIAKLNLATKELGFAKLKDEVALNLEASRRTKTIADENLDYFEKIGRPANEKDIAQDLKNSAFRLAAAKEELKQLQQMYDEDDLTEETEEIILERQKFSVEASEFSHSEAKRRADSRLKIGLPREHDQLKSTAATAAIALAKAEKDLPRSIATAELELKGARVAFERQKTELARIEKDGALLTWTAPADGVLVHGAIENGQWTLGDLAKSLRAGGSVPLKRTLLSFVPADTKAQLVAQVASSMSRSLQADTPVALTLAGREDLALSGKIGTIAATPDLQGKHSVTLNSDWPADTPVLWGSTVNCLVVSYEKTDAISVPTKALQFGTDGNWTVEVKLADGKTERRAVTRGHVSGKTTEITAGLEPGQVVVTPGE